MTKSEHPESVGAFLKSERERRGFTLEQVASATKIGLKILENLESSRFQDLPAMPFVKGFVRNYCQFLGLSSEKVLELYDSFLTQKGQERPDKGKGHQGYVFEQAEGEQAKKVLLSVLGALGVFGVLVLAVFKPSLKKRHHKHVEEIAVTTTPPAEVVPIPVAQTTGAASTPTLPTPPAASVPAQHSTVSVPAQNPAVAQVVPSSIPPTATPTLSAALQKTTPPSVVAPAPKSQVPVTPISATPAPAPKTSEAPKLERAAVEAPKPVEQVADSQKNDPLQSGLDLKPNEIKHKIVIEALADVWVRYRCDSKEPKRFALKKGKLLVLRGKEAVRFQASNPKAIKIRGAGGSKTMDAFANKMTYAGADTLVWPAEKTSSLAQEFKVEGSLPKTDDPAPPENPSPSRP